MLRLSLYKNSKTKKMKTLILIASLLISTGVAAQENESNSKPGMQTLLSDGGKATGWFAGLGMGCTEMNKEKSKLLFVEGGLVINHNLALGLKATGIGCNEHSGVYYPEMENGLILEGGWFGLVVEPSMANKSVVHLSFPLSASVGGLSLLTKDEFPEYDDGELDYSRQEVEHDVVGVFEAGIHIDVNITHFLIFTVGGQYRYLTGMDMTHFADRSLDGFTGSFGFKFGKF
jgi:hypothetical protein